MATRLIRVGIVPYKDRQDRRDWEQKQREGHKRRGLCIECENPIAFTVSSQYCLKHNIANNMYSRHWYMKNLKSERLKSKLRRENLAKEGRCQSCGIPLTEEDGRTQCINCLWKSNHPFVRQIKGGFYAAYLKRIARRP